MKAMVQLICYNKHGTLAETAQDIPRDIEGINDIKTLTIDDGNTDRAIGVARGLVWNTSSGLKKQCMYY